MLQSFVVTSHKRSKIQLSNLVSIHEYINIFLIFYFQKIIFKTYYVMVTARPVDPEKQPLLVNGCVTSNNGVTVDSDVFSLVRAFAA
jgi:hypothetical protein